MTDSDDTGPFFKWAIKSRILDYLYNQPINSLKKERCELVRNAAKTVGINLAQDGAYIYYRNQKYYSRDVNLNDLLSESIIKYKQIYINSHIEDQLISLIEDIDLIIEEKRIIDIYLNKILNICNTCKDITKLLPQSAHIFYTSSYVSNTLTLSTETIKEYRTETYKYAKILNERIMMNLITGE